VDQDGKDARNPKTGLVISPRQPKVHADLQRAGISREQVDSVREGMRRVVAEGTGKRAQIAGIQVAGKTGTAQFWRGEIQDNHTWFIAFAPFDAPRFAICVFVQGAKSGGGVSAPIAREILEQGLALDHGYNPGLIAMTPAVGSFDQINAVDYKTAPRALPAALSAPPETSEPRIARAIPVASPPPAEDADDQETVDETEQIEPVRRAIYVGPPRVHSPEIRPAADVIVEVRPPSS